LVAVMRIANLLVPVVLSVAPPAWAHAFLEHASPPAGSEIAVSPPEISITFTEGVEPVFSAIEVHGANGAMVSSGAPLAAPDNNRRLSIHLPKLPPGTYTVIWHVTSVDTHKTEGSYQFMITH
jgi:methionine-rich copper-binding protein CopC